MSFSFDEYKGRRDQDLFFENAGFESTDVTAVAKTMQQWVEATQQLVEALAKVPATSSSLTSSGAEVSHNQVEQALALEVQRARHVVEEGNLADMASRMNQYAARLAHGCSQLTD